MRLQQNKEIIFSFCSETINKKNINTIGDYLTDGFYMMANKQALKAKIY